MADQNITALPVATSPASSDQLLLVGATEEKLIDYDKLADAILTKLTSKQYTLDQGTKTLPAALNELNSKPSWCYNKSGDIIEISFSPESLGNGIAFGEYKQLLLRVDKTGMRLSGLNNSTGNWEIIWKK